MHQAAGATTKGFVGSRVVPVLRILLDLGLGGFAFCLAYRITPAQIFLLVALGAGLGLELAGERVFRTLGLGRPWLLLASGVALGALAAGADGATLGAPDAFGVYRIGMAVALVGLIGDAQRGFRLARIFVVAAALQAIVGVIQHYTGWQPAGSTPLRYAPFTPGRYLAIGTFARPSTLAFVTTSSVLFVSAAFMTGALRGRERWLAVLFAAPSAIGNNFAFTRTSWFTMSSGIASMSAVGRTVRNLAAIAALLGLVWGGTLLLSPAMQQKAKRTVAASYGSNSHRGFIWARSLEMLEDHPVTGVGVGTFTPRTHDYYDQMSDDPPVRCHAHNNLLHVWVESGPLGLVGLAWFLAAILGRFLRGARAVHDGDPRARALVLAGAGMAVHFGTWMLFHDPLYDGTIALTAAFGLAIGLAAIPVAETAPALERPAESDAAAEPPGALAWLAAAGLCVAVLGGLWGRAAAPAGVGLAAAAALVPIALSFFRRLPAGAGRTLEAIGVIAGAVLLASLPFAQVVRPGSAAWWGSASALTACAAVACGVAGIAWTIRHPRRIGAAQVAGLGVAVGAPALVWAIADVVLPYFRLGFNPDRTMGFNFAVAGAVAGLLLLGWSGPLGFGGGAARVRALALPRLVVAGGLVSLVVGTLT